MLSIFAPLVIIFIAMIFMFKRVDVRLSLGLSATGLFLIAGKLPQLFVTITQQMTNEKTVVPICTAMGFAYVLRLTECDRHLTHLLLAPLRHGRWLLIPGGIIAAYIVNMAIVSQSSTAAIVGTVLLPLLLAVNITPVIAGSLLLLGSSMGGELFNPGAVEIVKLAELTGQPVAKLVAQVLPINLLASITTLIVFCILAVILSQKAVLLSPEITKVDSDVAQSGKPFHLNLIKALVPLLPLALLFIIPALVQLPKEFSNNSVSIAAAMLIAVTAAGLTTPKESGGLVAAFFEGAGFAYANIISIIIVATIFTDGIKANGLIEVLTNALANRPVAVKITSLILPFTLAGVTGSGSAPAIAVMNVLVPVATTMNLDPVKIGALAAVAAQLGRTLSPVAAVVIMSATISKQPPLNLVKCVVLPLLAGLAAVIVATLCNWV
ncbi:MULTISPECIES: C4-dicarboxylate transporter DcuC [Cyanophyceae]|jgi:DcuC family C4-dicarboxylate transporter|uniref:C4-dicarboxylate transporter DcuC n=1 Tax=Cyanophyceae TaxID=3028117 RepID=UPI00232E76D4|nr:MULTISPECIES: C4-dicarboxylate transporter DcuC [Cyanophyceae]MDB9357799.1 C4-dicarboxylate transporter DcuC [Nodularia spumigena CS-587/03]MDB9306235.1 C4-dicarboxylate transporter DcuC [Nodularia spumigena CS-591/12]MDB9337831.1 C4-dicarboxylate transporter DcuC [Nodularia spumigena CS-589/07]MDB9342773.1 C4-dicarboxylate transporter DcuC [Nodularia spumigena CS-588/06]MDB9367772.1 C4-dicarboxylate transporter DcuC [Nodularia spumigena CS-586/05]